MPGKSHGQRSLVGYSPWGCKESDTTEQLHSLTHSDMNRNLNEGYTDGKRVHKEMFNTYHKGNANENFSERSLHVNQNDVIFFLMITPNTGENHKGFDLDHT